MSRRLLLGVCGGIGGLFFLLICWEILAPGSQSEIAAPATTGAPPPATPHAGPNGVSINTWVSTILGRPLFSLTRKPDAAPTSQAAATDDADKDLPRLSGIFLVSNVKHAVFQPTGDVPALVVGEGDQVQGWKVEKIGLSSVTLTGPGGETTLEPKFDDNLAPPAPQMPIYGKAPPPHGAPAPGQPPPQPQPAVQPPNPRGALPQTPAARQPGQPTPISPRLPLIPQPHTPQQGGVTSPPGAR
jgi:hypothetical protein